MSQGEILLERLSLPGAQHVERRNLAGKAMLSRARHVSRRNHAGKATDQGLQRCYVSKAKILLERLFSRSTMGRKKKSCWKA